MTACSNGGTDITETSLTTASESVSATETATVTETEAVTTSSDNQTETFSICGNEYTAEDIFITIDGNTLTEADKENIRRMEKLSAVSIENPNVQLVEMFAEAPEVTKIELVKFDGDISEYLDQKVIRYSVRQVLTVFCGRFYRGFL